MKFENNFKILENDILNNYENYISLGTIYSFQDKPFSTPLKLNPILENAKTNNIKNIEPNSKNNDKNINKNKKNIIPESNSLNNNKNII